LIRWFGWEWGGIGQAFVEYLRLLCACVAILCDIFKFNLMGSFSRNFNLVNNMLIMNESSVGAFLLTTSCLIFFVITFTHHLFTALAGYQP
jgi:hypothetical protein